MRERPIHTSFFDRYYHPLSRKEVQVISLRGRRWHCFRRIGDTLLNFGSQAPPLGLHHPWSTYRDSSWRFCIRRRRGGPDVYRELDQRCAMGNYFSSVCGHQTKKKKGLLCFQTVGILLRKTTKSYTLGTYAVLSLISYLAVILYQDSLLLGDPDIDGLGPPEDTIFRSAQLALTVFAGISSVSLPRRPIVFKEGVPVDGMYTVSALSRYSFTWVAPLLRLAHRSQRLELTDLPKMDHYNPLQGFESILGIAKASKGFLEGDHPCPQVAIHYSMVSHVTTSFRQFCTTIRQFSSLTTPGRKKSRLPGQ